MPLTPFRIRDSAEFDRPAEGTFRPDRIKAIAERFNVDPVAACENVIFSRAHNSEHRRSDSAYEFLTILIPICTEVEMELITNLAARFAEEQGVYRLLIVDSILALFR